MSVPLTSLGFFGIGDTEMLVIMVAILIFFGGQKMPELARGLGKALREFKRATSEVEREFKRVMDEVENPPAPMPKYTPSPSSLPAAPIQDLLPAAPTLMEGGSGGAATVGGGAELAGAVESGGAVEPGGEAERDGVAERHAGAEAIESVKPTEIGESAPRHGTSEGACRLTRGH